MNSDHPLFSKVHSFFDVGLEMRPMDDNILLIADLQRSKLMLSGIRTMAVPDEDNASNQEEDNLLVGPMDPPVVEDVQEEDDQSLDSAVSEDDDDIAENEAVAEDIPLDTVKSNFIERFLAVKKLSSMNSYRQHFTRTLGNIHTGYVRMNAVQDNEAENVKVAMAHPTAGFILGGQIYEPNVRMESMKQQRPKSGSILSMIPHFMNLCRRGVHLLGTTITESIKVVSKQLKALAEIYHHRSMRRTNANSNVLRIELFVAYKNGEKVVGSLPHFDPSFCVDLFHKKQVDDFEKRIVTSHFNPCQKLLGNIGALLQEGRQLDMAKFPSHIKTRITASLEISVLYVVGNIQESFIIQRNILREAVDAGITVDIPISAKVNLSEVERAQYGFDYGVQPCMLPLTDDHTRPPKFLSEIGTEHLSSKFPPYFSSMDRSVVRSLNMGMNVGKLERARAQVDAIIQHYSRELQENENPWNCGVMDDIAHDQLMTMSPENRKGLLKDLARLLVICYCHTTWELCKKHNVFGDNPDLVLNDDAHLVDPQDFENFPFIERKVTDISNQLGDTRFVRMEDVSSTGKCLCLKIVFCQFSPMFLVSMLKILW
jgi:hypothetical protein